MVIEKILKVNSSDPRVDELRKKLAAIQQQQAPADGPRPAPTPPPHAAAGQSGQAAALASQPATTTQPRQDEIAKLTQLSFDEQKRLLERQDPNLRLKEERTLNLIMNQVKELITLNNEGNKRIKELESKNTDLQKQLDLFKDKNEETAQKMNGIDSRLEKFMGLYELITNQYNPFAENLAPVGRLSSPSSNPPPPQQGQPRTLPPLPSSTSTGGTSNFSPKPTAGTIKVQDSLTSESATVEVSPEDASAAAQRFKQVEQLLAQLRKEQVPDHAEKSAAAPAPNPKAQPTAEVTSEIHALLAGFEDRIKTQFDASLQDKLHHGFAALEESLQSELRDALREELEQLQHDDEETQRTLAELQALVQANESKDRELYEAQLAELTHEVSHVRDDMKAIPPNLYFHLANGGVLRDIHELSAALPLMTSELFGKHVDIGKNDFANWVEYALKMPDHAHVMRQATSLEQMRHLFANAK